MLAFVMVLFFVCARGELLEDAKLETLFWRDESIDNSDRRSIVNGYNAPNRAFYVFLLIGKLGSETFACGGTIVGRTLVVTAAHCFDESEEATVNVFVGDFTKPGLRNKRLITGRRIVYYDYMKKQLSNDIAKIQLNKPVRSSQVLPICDHKKYQSEDLIVAGLGQLDHLLDSLPADVLQEARITERPRGECRESTHELKLHKQLCAGDDRQGSCFGDSGGPLFVARDGQPVCLYGIVSYGNTECRGDTVYTRASYYTSWINSY